MRRHAIGATGSLSVLLGMALALLVGCGAQIAGPGTYDEVRDDVLDRYFTEEAAQILREIPLNQGTVNLAGAFAVGPDWGSRLASWVFGNGCHRQVLVTSSPDELIVFHEYVHQADYSGLIDRQAFAEQYARLKADDEYRQIAEGLEETILWFHSLNFWNQVALAYHDGMTRELIAHLIEGYVGGDYDLPDYLLEVYAPVVRIRGMDDGA